MGRKAYKKTLREHVARRLQAQVWHKAPRALNRLVYRWLSDITHANLESLNQTVRRTDDNSFEVYTGGSIYGKSKMVNALFGIVCDGLRVTAILCVAVFDSARLEKAEPQWVELEKRIKASNT